MYTKENMATNSLMKPKFNIFYVKDIVNSINEYITDDNNLLKCNKYLYDLKLKSYKLNREYSLRYYNDAEFRNVIHSKITNPITQLNKSVLTLMELEENFFKLFNIIHLDQHNIFY